MRRFILEEPIAWSATWSRRVALFAAAVMGIAVWLIRSERVDGDASLALLGAACVLALATLVLAVLGFAAVWQHGQRGTARAVLALLVALGLLAGPAMALGRALLLPPLADISTDLADPPAFSRSRAVTQARDGYMPPEIAAADKELQRLHYPQVVPIYVDAEPVEAFEIVRKAVLARGLDIVETVRPGGRTGIGRIEAVEHSLVLRRPDDVTIRLKGRGEGTRVDIRAASRRPGHDLGANAALIQRLAEEIATQALAN